MSLNLHILNDIMDQAANDYGCYIQSDKLFALMHEMERANISIYL